MIDRFREFVAQRQLLSRDLPLVLGFSGGADSLALLHLLRADGYNVLCAHLHHGQRPEADSDEEFCRDIAVRLGASFVSERIDVPAFARERKCALEEAGRIARYKFFETTGDDRGISKIATGHTLDDNIETVFFNLARGTGLPGLLGIPIVRGRIIRPLLFARRIETENYCKENGLEFTRDSGNFDEQFSRVRNRLHLIPAFENLHDCAAKNMARTLEILKEENLLLDSLATEALLSSAAPENHDLAFIQTGEIRLDAARLRTHKDVIIRRALYLAASELAEPFEFSHLDSVTQAIRNQKKSAVTSEHGRAHIECDHASVIVRSGMTASFVTARLTTPGSVYNDAAGWHISSEPTSCPPGNDPRSLVVVIDAEKIHGEILVRTFEPGDRMQPFGSSSPRKLQDLLTNAKIPQALKRQLPIFCDGVGPFWIPGVALDVRVAVTAGAQKRIKITFGPIIEPRTV